MNNKKKKRVFQPLGREQRLEGPWILLAVVEFVFGPSLKKSFNIPVPFDFDLTLRTYASSTYQTLAQEARFKKPRKLYFRNTYRTRREHSNNIKLEMKLLETARKYEGICEVNGTVYLRMTKKRANVSIKIFCLPSMIGSIQSSFRNFKNCVDECPYVLESRINQWMEIVDISNPIVPTIVKPSASHLNFTSAAHHYDLSQGVQNTSFPSHNCNMSTHSLTSKKNELTEEKMVQNANEFRTQLAILRSYKEKTPLSSTFSSPSSVSQDWIPVPNYPEAPKVDSSSKQVYQNDKMLSNEDSTCKSSSSPDSPFSSKSSFSDFQNVLRKSKWEIKLSISSTLIHASLKTSNEHEVNFEQCNMTVLFDGKKYPDVEINQQVVKLFFDMQQNPINMESYCEYRYYTDQLCERKDRKYFEVLLPSSKELKWEGNGDGDGEEDYNEKQFLVDLLVGSENILSFHFKISWNTSN